MTTMNNRLTAEELKKLRQTDFGKKPSFETADTMLAREVGEAGSPERDEFNAKALAWYYGEVLRDRRKELGITQKELAEKMNCTQQYISKILKGRENLSLEALCEIELALGIRILQFDSNN